MLHTQCAYCETDNRWIMFVATSPAWPQGIPKPELLTYVRQKLKIHWSHQPHMAPLYEVVKYGDSETQTTLCMGKISGSFLPGDPWIGCFPAYEYQEGSTKVNWRTTPSRGWRMIPRYFRRRVQSLSTEVGENREILTKIGIQKKSCKSQLPRPSRPECEDSRQLSPTFRRRILTTFPSPEVDLRCVFREQRPHTGFIFPGSHRGAGAFPFWHAQHSGRVGW